MALKWKDSYKIGIVEIDQQHQQLFDQVNELMVACRERKGKEKIGEVLYFLIDYTKEHFRTEEKLQRECGYPKYQEHKKIHDEFVQQVSEVKEKFDNEGIGLLDLINVNKMVSEWLLKHVTGVDQELKTYVK